MYIVFDIEVGSWGELVAIGPLGWITHGLAVNDLINDLLNTKTRYNQALKAVFTVSVYFNFYE